jgi:predicted site-specific integrase-resolvase
LVIAHRDRLSRLAFELFEFLVTQSGGSIVVLDGGDSLSTEAELGEDLLSIIHVFSSRHYGLRRYPNKKRIKGRENEEEKKDNEENKET